MADLTTTQLKLRTTPTAGVASEQSPYYRRLLSAGYKGFLQGTVGGSTLYGAIGAVIGACVAIPLIPFTGGSSLLLIPAMGGIGVYKGASTFGNIGSLAAITAESAEMSEKRRYLLDRYYDLPDTPEFDQEAKQIRELLAKQHESKQPTEMFHIRGVIVGAAIGTALTLGFIALSAAAPTLGLHALIFEPLLNMLGTQIAASGFATAIAGGIVTAAGAALGALSGAMIGLDRYYVRSWLDKSATLMHDSKSIESQIVEREREIQQLGTEVVSSNAPSASKSSATGMKINVSDTSAPSREVEESHPHGTRKREMPISPRDIAGLSETPSTVASHVQLDRKVSLEQALHNPVL